MGRHFPFSIFHFSLVIEEARWSSSELISEQLQRFLCNGK